MPSLKRELLILLPVISLQTHHLFQWYSFSGGIFTIKRSEKTVGACLCQSGQVLSLCNGRYQESASKSMRMDAALDHWPWWVMFSISVLLIILFVHRKRMGTLFAISRMWHPCERDRVCVCVCVRVFLCMLPLLPPNPPPRLFYQ